jgi:hypothetical protein
LDSGTIENRETKDNLFIKYWTTTREYLYYGRDHKSEIESYLEENPEVKKTIDAAKKRIDSLIEEFETIASANQKGDKQ